MKRFFIALFTLLLTWTALNAQVQQPPQAFNYQAIARDSFGNILANRPVSLRFSILDNSAIGPVLYIETFNTTTNAFGLFNLQIGTGRIVTGSFKNIDWSMNSKWLQVELDASGGNNYVVLSAAQLVSVPYSLYAGKSGFSQTIATGVSTGGDTLYIGGTALIVPGISNANACRFNLDTVPYTRNYPQAGENPYNTTLYGLPKIILNNYIDLDKIDSISRFRSGAGHDYSDSYESCRSMKHYFRPRYDVDWGSVKIFSPVNGTISSMIPDSIWGIQLRITPLGMPAFDVTIFHVHLDSNLTVGSTLTSGQLIGTHFGHQTTSDIAIRIFTGNNSTQLVSYFDIMTDKLFNCYSTRGVMTRDTMIISKAARDADQLLPCNGQQFFYSGTIPNWVQLH